MSLFATAPKGVAPLLIDELLELGATEAKETAGGVRFSGTAETAYRVCLWSRFAGRLLLPLARFAVDSAEALYEGARSVDWSEHLSATGRFVVDFTGTNQAIRQPHFGALKVKDAVVDQFLAGGGIRPSVSRDTPDLRINVYLHRDRASLSLDLSGEPLQRRGYRVPGAAFQLNENVAAAVLRRAGWPEMAAAGGAFVDLQCGSGVLPIEAALMAADIAPGLLREQFGFSGWLGHRPALWRRLVEEAQSRREQGLSRLPPVLGCEADPRYYRTALEQVQRAGLSGRVHIERCEPAMCRLSADKGLVVMVPPYQSELPGVEKIAPLYAVFGSVLRDRFLGWEAALFTGNPELGKRTGLRATAAHTLYNDAVACKLLHFQVVPERYLSASADAEKARDRRLSEKDLSPGARMFANRLRKNRRELGRWAERGGIDCYRLYDADIPEYKLAVDLYHGEALWVHLQEYAAPAGVDPGKARERLQDALAAVQVVLEVPREQVFLKIRQRQKGKAQYERQAEEGHFYPVQEGNCRFLVNLSDYLDTGLFLDHRITRQLVQDLAKGRRFLNLFAYTGTASVHAAKGGAVETTTVDMSKTYIDWARRNMALNGFGGDRHRFIQADCLQWLAEQSAAIYKHRYGLIFLDPPTFSSSKRMQESFDVQRDHVRLIRQAVSLLESGGILIFSNNYRGFEMDREALEGLLIEDITHQTIPKDFARNPKIHNCWKITQESSSRC